MAHLSRFGLGVRTKCELSSEEMRQICKDNLLMSPYARIDDWMGLADDPFIKHFQPLMQAFASKTYRLNELGLKSAMQKTWKADKHECEIFCGKVVKAFQAAWLKSKKLKSGERTSPHLMALFSAWAGKNEADEVGAKSEPVAKTEPSIKLEQPSSSGVSWAGQAVKRPAPAFVKAELQEESPKVKRALGQVPSSPLVPAVWSSPRTKWAKGEGGSSSAGKPTCKAEPVASATERLTGSKAPT